ncbi:Neurolysin [Cercospora zeina]
MASKWLLKCLIATWTLHQGCEAAALSPHLAKRQGETLSSGAKRPPQAPHVFNETVESITKAAEDYVQSQKAFGDAFVKSVSVQDATFENVVLPWVMHGAGVTVEFAYSQGFTSWHPNKDLRDAVDAVSGNLTDAETASYTREDIYQLFTTVYQKQGNDSSLDAESRLLIAQLPEDFEDSGLMVEAGAQRDRYIEISQRLQDLAQDFNNAVQEDNTTLWFTPDELPGVQQETLDALIEGDGENKGKLGIAVQAPSSSDVITYCTNGTTREALYVASSLVAPGNVKILEETLALRDEQARLAGQPNFAASVIKDMMAKTPEAVEELQKKVQDVMTPKLASEEASLKQMKQKNGEDASHVWIWDLSLYQRLVLEEASTLTIDQLREYFPAVQTLHRILDLYGELFGITFVKIEGQDADELSPTGKGADLTWDSDVDLYAVWDNTASGDFLGYIYLDIYYRPEKGGGAFMQPMEPGFTESSGNRHYPTAGLFTNFRKAEANATRPSLMSRYEVSALMHEAGHGMHQLLSKTRYVKFHGPYGCPLDWVEMPSQLMEQFAYAPEVLKRLSQHYTRVDPKYAAAYTQNGTQLPPETLPDAAIEDIIKNKVAFSGQDQLEQIALGQIDQIYHTPKSQDDAKHINSTAVYNDEVTEICEYEGMGTNGGHGQTTFTHIEGGYEAKYYAYLWSRVNAIDVYYTAFKSNPINPEAGRRWREQVLQIGGATDDFEGVLDNFLGHKAPDLNPTLDNYGVNNS